MLLAFCLICLMAGMMIVLLSLDKNGAELRKQRQTAHNNITKGEMLSNEDYAPRTIQDILNDKMKDVDILGESKDAPKGALLEPVRLYLCTTEDCGHLLPFNIDKCPFCGKEQPEIAKESPDGIDTDMDGMPDSFEKKYMFLSLTDPSDAEKDEDGDGFTNVEEYKAGTKPDDSTDFPRLATHARCLAVFRNPINIRLEEIDTNRKEDQAQWDIRFTYPDPRYINNPKAKWKTAMTRLDGENNLIAKTGYKIVKANIEGAGESAVMTAVIQNVNDPTEEYTLTAKEEPQKSKYVTVRLIYMTSRSANDLKAMMKRAKVVNIGEEFELEKSLTASSNFEGDMMGTRNMGRARKDRNDENSATEEVVKERYRVISADEESGVCKVGYIDKEGGTVLTEFEVKKFDREVDLIDNEMRGGMDALDDMTRPTRRPARR